MFRKALKYLLVRLLLVPTLWVASTDVQELDIQECQNLCEERCRYLMLQKFGEEREDRCEKKCKKKNNYCFSQYASLQCKAEYQDESSICYDNDQLQFAAPLLVYEDANLGNQAGFEAIITMRDDVLEKDVIVFAGDAVDSNYSIYLAQHVSDDDEFLLSTIIEQDTPVTELASADLDGDGLLDLLISGTQPAVRYISGFDVTSSKSDVVPIYQNGTSHGSFPVDLNNDGIMDVVSGIRRKDVRFFPGSGIGSDYSIGDESELVNGIDICGIHDIFAVDLDGDGTAEIMTGGDSFPLSYLKKKEEEGSSEWELHLVDQADEDLIEDICDLSKGADREPGTRYYCAADLNNDGIMDLVATYKWPVISEGDTPYIEDDYSASLVWYPGQLENGNLSYGPKNVLVGAMPNDGEDHGMFGLTCADFDGDGFIDIAATDRRASQVLLLKNHGKGRFGYPRITDRQELQGCDYLDQITHGDLDGDGKPDLAMVCKKSAQVLWMQNVEA